MTACPNCEYHKNRAARWRAEAYKQAGHDVIELPWVGLTDGEIDALHTSIKVQLMGTFDTKDIYRAVEQALKEKNT